MRTVASQMADAVGQSMVVRLGGVSSAGEDAEFGTSGRVITFPGFLRAYVEGSDDPDAELEDREVRLPPLAVGDPLAGSSLTAEGHATQPPARYTEASLVKALEDMGVGRPSTYATILDTIEHRGYVWKKGAALVPSWTAFAVTGLLERYFGELVDYGFTASMEEDLDEIARGGQESVPWLTRSTSATAAAPASSGWCRSTSARSTLGRSTPSPSAVPDSGVVVRVGRYGPYVQEARAERAPVPEDLAPDELTVARAVELLEAGSTERVVGIRSGVGSADRGPGRAASAPMCRWAPGSGRRRRSDTGPTGRHEAGHRLPPGQHGPGHGDARGCACGCCRCPGWSASIPATGEEIVASNGRYGPYLKRGSDSRSLESEDQLFTVGLDEAVALFAQPKTRRGRGAAAAPLRELGPDPRQVLRHPLKDGRFGPYVTDGDHQRLAAQGRHGRRHHAGTGRRAAGRPAGRRAPTGRPGKAGDQEGGRRPRRRVPRRPRAQAGGAKKAAGRQEGAAQEGGGARRPAAGCDQGGCQHRGGHQEGGGHEDRGRHESRRRYRSGRSSQAPAPRTRKRSEA